MALKSTEKLKKTSPKKVGRPKKPTLPKAPAKKVRLEKKAKKLEPQAPKPSLVYFEAVGRRKEAVARVRFSPKGEARLPDGQGILVNNKPLASYFSLVELQNIVAAPLKLLESGQHFGVSIKVKGGGIRGQAEASRLGISRALIKFQPELRKRLKYLGFLTRDARVKERRKYGLKKARRAPQWQKR